MNLQFQGTKNWLKFTCMSKIHCLHMRTKPAHIIPDIKAIMACDLYHLWHLCSILSKWSVGKHYERSRRNWRWVVNIRKIKLPFLVSHEVSYILNNHQNVGFMSYLKDSIPPSAEFTFQHTELLICCLLKINASTNWNNTSAASFCGYVLQSLKWFCKVTPYKVRLFPEKYSWLAELERLTIILYVQ